jgi:hypothetical protein
VTGKYANPETDSILDYVMVFIFHHENNGKVELTCLFNSIENTQALEKFAAQSGGDLIK